MSIDKKKIAIILTAVAMAAIMSGIALTAFASDSGEENTNGFAGWIDDGMMTGAYGRSHGRSCGLGFFGLIEVSEEFEENATNIAKSDEDVQNLLNDGYNVTGVRPIIKTVVEADGTVVTKATSAVVLLKKDTTGYASVWVDMEEQKVTEIVIVTRTVIEKSS
jgi:hypothetical protein